MTHATRQRIMWWIWLVVLIAFLLCPLFISTGCVSNVQHIHIHALPNMPKGSDCRMLVIGAQLAAKPVDLGGIVSPTVDANAAASQHGQATAEKHAQ